MRKGISITVTPDEGEVPAGKSVHVVLDNYATHKHPRACPATAGVRNWLARQAAHSGKFVYKGERVSFDWDWHNSRRYRNINRMTVVAWDANGIAISRGNRNFKEWRTADQKPPGRDD
jgi:hypothetical protein